MGAKPIDPDIERSTSRLGQIERLVGYRMTWSYPLARFWCKIPNKEIEGTR